ncbi:hypothetical protein EDD18DRAFT_1356336 [Armillaria luteobubalina]|uniref:C2H2-type domain-containing protein n=1 Tax=Armillaria luteobubalina TaxID=153913 RepID=A0AA39Q084_9AGAR|nr:hypothetical protein EDD18DRAFT_1356336 [Armillaria luteobubalina]
MSFTGLEDTVPTSLVTVADHTVDSNALLRSSRIPVFRRQCHLCKAYLPTGMISCTSTNPTNLANIGLGVAKYPSVSGTIKMDWRPIVLSLYRFVPNIVAESTIFYPTICLQRSTGTDTKIAFDLGITHKHSDPSKVCFYVSTRRFWEIHRLTCTIPGNNLPPLVPTTAFILDVSSPLPASQLDLPIPQPNNLGNSDTVYGLAYSDNNTTSYHSSSPLGIYVQERDIRPLPRRSTHRRGTTIRDPTLHNLATTTKRKVPDNVDAPHVTRKRVKLVPASPVASKSLSSSSLTELSSSPPLSPIGDSPSLPRAEKPSDVDELHCIYPYCCERFPSVDRVIDHHESIHGESYSGKYRCAFVSCKQTFAHKADFKRHAEILLHQPDKQYLCAGCGMSFTRSDSRKRHQINLCSDIMPERREEGKKEMSKHRKKRQVKDQA